MVNTTRQTTRLLCYLLVALTAVTTLLVSPVQAFAPARLPQTSRRHASAQRFSAATAATGEGEPALSSADQKKEAHRQLIRQEGGRFAFDTKYGALNPFAIYYGLTAILLGIPWFAALTVYQLFAWVTRGKIDKQRKIPVLISHVWGTTLLRLTRCYPKMENLGILKKFFKT